MGLFNKIGRKNVDKIVGGAVSGIDKMFFTKEEKANFNKGMADSLVQFVKQTTEENSIRSITRRFIAFAIMFVYLGLVVSTAVSLLLEGEHTKQLFDLVKDQSFLAIMVTAFYFGGYYAQKFVGSKKK